MKYKPGDSVRVVGNPEVRKIEAFHEDLCGDGCCSGYTLEGDGNMAYWEGQLESAGNEI